MSSKKAAPTEKVEAEKDLYTTTYNGKFIAGGVELTQDKPVKLTAEVLALKSTQRAIKLGLVVKA